MAGTPAPGTTVEKTTRTRVIPGSSPSEPFNFWDYMEKLQSPAAENHLLYVYRDEPSPTMQVAKHVYPWTEIPWHDHEEAEALIAQKWGGRQFRVIVKNGSQRMGVARIQVNAPPKNLVAPVEPSPTPYQSAPGYAGYPGTQPQPWQPAPGPGYYDPSTRVAETAIHTMANQDKQAVEIGIGALKGAADVLAAVTQRGSGNGPMDDVMKQFMTVAMQRMLNPPDPMENITKILAFLKEVNPAPASGIPGLGGGVFDKVLTAVIERGMNPTPAGPAVSTGAELIRVLPNIAQYVSKGIEDYARITEAQRDVILTQRGAMPGQVVHQSAQRPAPQPVPIRPPLQTSTNANTAAAGAEEDVSMFANPQDFLEGKILEIFNEEQSAEAAAEEALAFLDRMSPDIVPQLTAQGEHGLMALFNTRPILKVALSNPARVSEFVRAFIKFASEPPAGQQAPPPTAS